MSESTFEKISSLVDNYRATDHESEQAIDDLIRRLRERLTDVDPDYNYVVTVRGHGFRLDNPI